MFYIFTENSPSDIDIFISSILLERPEEVRTGAGQTCYERWARHVNGCPVTVRNPDMKNKETVSNTHASCYD